MTNNDRTYLYMVIRTSDGIPERIYTDPKAANDYIADFGAYHRLELRRTSIFGMTKIRKVLHMIYRVSKYIKYYQEQPNIYYNFFKTKRDFHDSITYENFFPLAEKPDRCLSQMNIHVSYHKATFDYEDYCWKVEILDRDEVHKEIDEEIRCSLEDQPLTK